MLLAIDIGNTNIVIGCMKDDEIIFKARIATERQRTSDQYGVEIKNMIEAFGVNLKEIDDCIISSVVPPVFNSVRTGVLKIIGKQPMVLWFTIYCSYSNIFSTAKTQKSAKKVAYNAILRLLFIFIKHSSFSNDVYLNLYSNRR